jgi:hypothetical protein
VKVKNPDMTAKEKLKKNGKYKTKPGPVINNGIRQSNISGIYLRFFLFIC